MTKEIYIIVHSLTDHTLWLTLHQVSFLMYEITQKLLFYERFVSKTPRPCHVHLGSMLGYKVVIWKSLTQVMCILTMKHCSFYRYQVTGKLWQHRYRQIRNSKDNILLIDSRTIPTRTISPGQFPPHHSNAKSMMTVIIWNCQGWGLSGGGELSWFPLIIWPGVTKIIVID